MQNRDLHIEIANEDHVVFDDDDRMIFRNLLQQDRRLRRLGVGHAGDRLVHQQEFRVLRQQHADLEPLLLPVGQIGSGPKTMIRQPRRHEDFVDPLALFTCRAREHGRKSLARKLQREQNVVLYGMAFEDGRLLELSADPEIRNLRLVKFSEIVTAVEIDVAFVGPRLAGNDVHHRRLAGAVRSDDRAHLALRQRQ